jgi:putative tryptophan/tyrosine transport system substrate-binding protein
MLDLRRRDFITLLGGAAVGWPLAARAQQSERVRLVGILMGSADNVEMRSRIDAFVHTFQELGWIEGRNVRIDLRWGGSPDRIAAQARELVQLQPDVIFVGPTNALIPLQKETRNIPIVFVSVSDPLGQGFVQSVARPTGNITGFSNLEFSLIGKWLQILKEAVPDLRQVAFMISTANASSLKWYQSFNAIAPTAGIEPIAAPIRDRTDIEDTVKSIARVPNSALIVAGDTLVEAPPIRRLIVDLTAAHRLPALYGVLTFAGEGGLIVYGIDQVDPYRRAAGYVDRILKGEKPGDLPVQQPTKFRFVINLKTAKAFGLELSPTLVATADEVIE